ncbi:DNA methyltransferase [Escherichia coli]
MSRFIQGDCVRVMATFPGNAVDFILTDPPYLVGFRDRQGRTIAGDKTDEWLQPACNEMYRVLKKDALMVSFYGWNRVDRFMAAWKNAGFSVVGHLVFTKTYTSKAAYVGYRHECAYILAKGRPALPQKPLPDVLGWKYSGNRHHPTEKPVTRVLSDNESKVFFEKVKGQYPEMDIKIPFLTVMETLQYKPAESAAKVQCPVLIVIAGQDSVNPPEQGKALYDAVASGTKELYEEADACHYDIYEGAFFERVAAVQTQWFKKHL